MSEHVHVYGDQGQCWMSSSVFWKITFNWIWISPITIPAKGNPQLSSCLCLPRTMIMDIQRTFYMGARIWTQVLILLWTTISWGKQLSSWGIQLWPLAKQHHSPDWRGLERSYIYRAVEKPPCLLGKDLGVVCWGRSCTHTPIGNPSLVLCKEAQCTHWFSQNECWQNNSSICHWNLGEGVDIVYVSSWEGILAPRDYTSSILPLKQKWRLLMFSSTTRRKHKLPSLIFGKECVNIN